VTHRLKLWGAFILLAGIHALVLFAGFFAPYDFATQNRERAFAAPTHVHFVDTQARFHVRPFVYGLRNDPASPDGYAEDSTQIYPVRFFSRGSTYTLAGRLPSRLHLFSVDDPGRLFLMGSDAFGRDQFSRFLYGGRISLTAFRC
jgi:peptide/nickel transport system permease protein